MSGQHHNQFAQIFGQILDLASDNSSKEIGEILEKMTEKEREELFKVRDGDFNLFCYMCCAHNTSCLEVVLRNGATPNAGEQRMLYTTSPLQQMLEQANDEDDNVCAGVIGEVARVCREFNLPWDVNEKGASGFTMLHACAMNNFVNTATILINYGADVNAEDYYRVTPLYVAIQDHCDEMVALLQTHNAIAHEVEIEEVDLFEFIDDGFLDENHSHEMLRKFGGALWPAEYIGKDQIIPCFCSHQVPKLGQCIQIKMNIHLPNKMTFTWMWGVIAEILDDGRQLVIVAKLYPGHFEAVTELGEKEWRCLLRFDPTKEFPYLLISMRELTPLEQNTISREKIVLEHSIHLDNPWADMIIENETEQKFREKTRCTVLKGFEHDHGDEGHGHGHGHSHGHNDDDVIHKIDFSINEGPQDVRLIMTLQDGKVRTMSVENGDDPTRIIIQMLQMMDMLQTLEDEAAGPEVIISDPNQIIFQTSHE
jgi:hypothetical protein